MVRVSSQAWILIAVVAALLVVAFVAGFVLYKRRRVTLTPPVAEKELTDSSGGYAASGGFTFSQRGTATAARPAVVEASAPTLEGMEPAAGGLVRLRGRLSRSQNAVGKSLLGLLGGGDLDDDSWEEVEDTLVLADIGTASTAAIVARL